MTAPDSGPSRRPPPPPAPARRVAGPVVPGEVTKPSLAAESSWRFAGHEILRELARGGLGVVFLARHPLLDELRAIKRPLDHAGIDSAMIIERFQREVRAVGRLRHDHIIRAHDAGSDQHGPYLVMEYLDGLPLSSLVQRLGPLPVPLACELARQAALGLQAAHEAKMVHRDIKPSNLMLARHGSGARVVIIDWGLVKWSEDTARYGTAANARFDLTMEGTTVGTVGSLGLAFASLVFYHAMMRIPEPELPPQKVGSETGYWEEYVVPKTVPSTDGGPATTVLQTRKRWVTGPPGKRTETQQPPADPGGMGELPGDDLFGDRPVKKN